MRTTTETSLRKRIKMPIRDALRGVAAFASGARKALPPSASISGFTPIDETLESAVDAIRSVAEPTISQNDIAGASLYLAGQSTRRSDIITVVRVIVRGWQHLAARYGMRDQLISEVLVERAVSAAEQRSSDEPHDFAARLFCSLHTGRTVGRFPGSALSDHQSGRARAEAGLFSVFVWLSADRETTLAREFELLEMAHALSGEESARMQAGIDQPAVISAMLRSLSGQL